jgi:hypothetical protein
MLPHLLDVIAIGHDMIKRCGASTLGACPRDALGQRAFGLLEARTLPLLQHLLPCGEAKVKGTTVATPPCMGSEPS